MSGTRIGLVRCEHCGRQFNPHSGARHIPWCAKQQSDNKRNKPSAEKRQALERYKWRISYRPSNQFYQQSSSKPPERFQNRIGNKCSINSLSNVSSSLSASSSNSVGSNSNEGLRARQQNLIHSQIGAPSRRNLPQMGLLKRSISSLTMTKQSGLSKAIQPARVGQTSDQLSLSSVTSSKMRPAKSHADLGRNSMDEVVEAMARRMDEIFAQNQLLLARFISKQQPLDTDSTTSDNEAEDCQTDTVICHHCKLSCLAQANYCHRCGCKLCHTSSSPSC